MPLDVPVFSFHLHLLARSVELHRLITQYYSYLLIQCSSSCIVSIVVIINDATSYKLQSLGVHVRRRLVENNHVYLYDYCGDEAVYRGTTLSSCKYILAILCMQLIDRLSVLIGVP